MSFLATNASKITIGNAYRKNSGTENRVEAVVKKIRKSGFVALRSGEVLTAAAGVVSQIR